MPRRGRSLIAAAVLALSLGACGPLVLMSAGGAAGIAAYKFYHGALEVIFEAPFMETWEASEAALKQMNFKISSAEHDLSEGTFRARSAKNDPVTLSLTYKSARETKVVIRHGVLGDKDASMAVKDKIREILFGP